MSLFDQQITVRHPAEATRDPRGNDMAGWKDPVEVSGWYETRSSTRDVEARDQVTSGYWLYLQEDEHFTDQSQALINGRWHRVDGRAETQPGGILLGGYRPIALTDTTG